MYNIKLTSVTGMEKVIRFTEKKLAEQFIKELPTKLPEGSRVRIDADLLGVTGHISGIAK
jgi:hypothetical protein